jgi:hypothetical protein
VTRSTIVEISFLERLRQKKGMTILDRVPRKHCIRQYTRRLHVNKAKRNYYRIVMTKMRNSVLRRKEAIEM